MLATMPNLVSLQCLLENEQDGGLKGAILGSWHLNGEHDVNLQAELRSSGASLKSTGSLQAWGKAAC